MWNKLMKLFHNVMSLFFFKATLQKYEHADVCVSFLMVKQGVGIISSDRSKVGGCGGAGSVASLMCPHGCFWVFMLHFYIFSVCVLFGSSGFLSSSETMLLGGLVSINQESVYTVH